jgi:hypothetical protein
MTTYTVHHNGKWYKGVKKDLKSPHQFTQYEVGGTVKADRLDMDLSRDCSNGIHITRTIAEALRWGPVVLEVSIPDGAVIVDTGSKVRTSEVTVDAGADLGGAYLGGAYLGGANLTDAYLRGANLENTQGNKYTSLPAGYEVTSTGLVVRQSK